MIKVHVVPEAEQEISEAMRWYETKRPGLGVSFLTVLDETFERMADHPRSYPLWKESRPYRKAPTPRFPFTVFFTVGKDIVQVVAVAHQKRRPGYWTDR